MFSNPGYDITNLKAVKFENVVFLKHKLRFLAQETGCLGQPNWSQG